MTIFILDSVTDFYLMCHDIKEPTKSNFHLRRLLSTVQVCSSHPVAEGPGTVWKIRAARASCTPSDPPILPSWLLYDSTKQIEDIFWEFQPFTQINNSSLSDDKFQSSTVGRRLITSMENSSIGTLSLQTVVCLNPTIHNFLDVK